MKVDEREAKLNRMQRTCLKQIVTISRIITMYYFEHGKDYVFQGERHNFWEFLYVDKGEIEVWTDHASHLLKQGTVIFHRPNEFHRFRAAPGTAPNVIVLTFDCDSAAMDILSGQVIRLEDEERNVLAQLVQEGENAFEFPFEYPLKRKQEAPEGAEQLFRCYLEIFLLRLMRRAPLESGHSTAAAVKQLSTPAQERSQAELTERIIRCLEGNLEAPLTVETLSRQFHLSQTRLKELFKSQTGMTLMKYWTRLKIDRAKLLIREETCNYTEIAQQLGYGSVHSFSRMFKQASGMSPTEYARSIKARMGHTE
ncbi:AraC family transcriptional regulator [Paenibacillus lutrae]|uniref:Helix-turn-helix domain-containing protein n=1 Tax=Paenibacillus lutrae TaxID=2078573 RepID=A0A7X3FJW6_9BACL|nr:AraC family transcriptional regulator [Paenibacillus lutrae]MVP01070.1 helix-turn-helix domain-containing protein [Paenibacillus lutrae]